MILDPLNQILDKIKSDVEEKYKNSSYTSSYLVFLDILGMRNLVGKDFETLRKVFNVSEVAINTYGKISIGTGDKFLSDNQVKLTTMSDSIVISINSNIDYAFSKIVGISSYLIKNFITAIDLPIFLRGAIVKGDIYHSGEMVFGPALVDAYTLESQEALNMRCILSKELLLDESVIKYMKASPHVFHQDIVDNYKFISFINTKNKDIISNYSASVLESDESEDVKSKYQWLVRHIEKIDELPEA